MNVYERAFLRYLKIKEIKEDRQIIQSGGVLETIQIGKHKLSYDITSYGNDTIDLLAVASKKANDKQPCFMMTITPGGASELQSISRGISCFEEDHDNSADIVLAALEIAKLKGAKTFEFTDNSTKTVNGKKLPLADLIFLTTGKTWYERILPIKLVTSNDISKVDSWRYNAFNNKWSDIKKLLVKQKISSDFDESGININVNGSAMEILNRAKLSKKYDVFFYTYMEELMIASLIPPLKGKQWIMDIS